MNLVKSDARFYDETDENDEPKPAGWLFLQADDDDDIDAEEDDGDEDYNESEDDDETDDDDDDDDDDEEDEDEEDNQEVDDEDEDEVCDFMFYRKCASLIRRLCQEDVLDWHPPERISDTNELLNQINDL